MLVEGFPKSKLKIYIRIIDCTVIWTAVNCMSLEVSGSFTPKTDSLVHKNKKKDKKKKKKRGIFFLIF